jgi:hypothetical protein
MTDNKCSICQCQLTAAFNHNAQPVNAGRCCDECNMRVVIPYRLLITQGLGDFLQRLIAYGKVAK